MRDNFDKALAAVLVHEGGYVNHPKDPGGATNKGVTQAVYDDYRARHVLPRQSVKYITEDEVKAIYRHQYWERIKGDQLPAGVDYCVFDFAVNSGVHRASRYLQRAVGVAEDGTLGPVTMAAVAAMGVECLVDALCNARLSFLKGLTTFSTFGRGWTRRVEDVRIKGKAMA